MSQTSGEQPPQLATARAEALLDDLGHRMSLFVTQMGQRVQSVAVALRDQTAQIERPSTGPGEQTHSAAIAGAEEQGELAMVRAEDLVHRFEQRLGHFTSLAGTYIQRQTARLREESEDIWAEAQNIRCEKTHASP